MSPTPDVIRMLTLVPWLLERPGATVAEIAEAFAVPEATVRRELAHLDFCGLPGLGGGDLIEVSIVGDSVVVAMADELRRPMRTTPAETLRLLLAAALARRMLGAAAEPLDSALAKLGAVLGVPDGAVVVAEDEPGDLVASLRAAIADGRRIRMSYRGRGDEAPVTRTLDPWAVELVDGAWYLHAYDHGAGEGRTFRLDRAGELRVGMESVTVPVPERLETPRYVPRPEDPEVEVLIGPGATWLVDAVEIPAGGIIAAPGGRSARFQVGAPEWFARLVLMAAGHAEVRAPGPIRELVQRRALEGLERLAATPAVPPPDVTDA